MIASGVGVTDDINEPEGVPVKVNNMSNSIFFGKALVLDKEIADREGSIHLHP